MSLKQFKMTFLNSDMDVTDKCLLHEFTRAMHSMITALLNAFNCRLAAIDEMCLASKVNIDTFKKTASQQLNGLFMFILLDGCHRKSLLQSGYDVSLCCCIYGQLRRNVRESYFDDFAYIILSSVAKGVHAFPKSVLDQSFVPGSE